MFEGGSLRQRWVLWGQVVFVDPGVEGVGEECVLTAGVVEVVGGVDEGGGAWGVSVGPVGRYGNGRLCFLYPALLQRGGEAKQCVCARLGFNLYT